METKVKACSLARWKRRAQGLQSNIYHDLDSLSYGFADRVFLYNQTKDNLSLLQRLKLARKLEVHNGCVNTISWNDSGRLLLSGSDDLTLVLSDPYSQKVIERYKSPHHGNIFAARFLPNTSDRQIVSSSADGSICHTVLGGPRDKCSQIFNCHRGAVYEISTDANDSNTFLSCGEDGTVRWFDLRVKSHCDKRNCLDDVMLNCRKAVMALSLNPARPYQLALGCADSKVRILDRRMLGTRATGNYCSRSMKGMLHQFSAPELSDENQRITSLQYSRDGEELLVSYSGSNIYLFNFKGGDGRQTSLEKSSQAESSADMGGASGGQAGNGGRSLAVKRLRLRGDWSDTGPNALPESERAESSSDGAAVSMMQRMSSLLTRWLENNAQRQQGDGAQGSASGTAMGSIDQAAINLSSNQPVDQSINQSPASEATAESNSSYSNGGNGRAAVSVAAAAAALAVQSAAVNTNDIGATVVAENVTDTAAVISTSSATANAAATIYTNAADNATSVVATGASSADIANSYTTATTIDNADDFATTSSLTTTDGAVNATRHLNTDATVIVNNNVVAAIDNANIDSASASDSATVISEPSSSAINNTACNKPCVPDSGAKVKTPSGNQVKSSDRNRSSKASSKGDFEGCCQASACNEVSSDTRSIRVKGLDQDLMTLGAVGGVEDSSVSCDSISQETAGVSSRYENICLAGKTGGSEDQSNHDPKSDETSKEDLSGRLSFGVNDIGGGRYLRMGSNRSGRGTTGNSDIDFEMSPFGAESVDQGERRSDRNRHHGPETLEKENFNKPFSDAFPRADGNAAAIGSAASREDMASRSHVRSYNKQYSSYLSSNHDDVSRTRETSGERNSEYSPRRKTLSNPLPDVENTMALRNSESTSASAEAKCESSNDKISAIKCQVCRSRAEADVAPLASSAKASKYEGAMVRVGTRLASDDNEDIANRIPGDYFRAARMLDYRYKSYSQDPREEKIQLAEPHQDREYDESSSGIRAGASARSVTLDREMAALKLQELYRKRREERETDDEFTKRLPRPSVSQVYKGHRNSRTMIKETSFWGDDYVVSGSDCGHIFIWDKHSARLVMLLEGDRHVVNSIQPHPFDPVLATSGIDYDIKLWMPIAEVPSFDEKLAAKLLERNRLMLEETQGTVTVPATFMLRMLASLTHLQQQRGSADTTTRQSAQREGRQRENNDDDSSDDD